jgi:hypothetical protein
MKWNWSNLAVLAAASALLLALPSCGHQRLVAITVSPSQVIFGEPAQPGITQTPVQLTAYGTYIEPSETKNITNQVTWSTDVPSVVSVNGGSVTAGQDCGVATVTASFFTHSGDPKGNVIVGTATVTVDGPASLGCPTVPLIAPPAR